MAQIPKEERNELRMQAAIEHMHQFSVTELTMIFRTSVQEIIKEAQKAKPSKHPFDKGAVNVTGGRMPVDTGALRASLISELNGGQLKLAKKSKNPNALVTNATVLISKLGIGDTLKLGWTVKYAEYQEFGTQNEDKSIRMHGNFFMTESVKLWQRHVNVAVAQQKIRRNQAGRAIGGNNPRPTLELV